MISTALQTNATLIHGMIPTAQYSVNGRLAGMKRKLAKEALFSSKLFNEHRLRARRRLDGRYQPEGVTDVESPETCWERVTATTIQRVDPHGDRALALLRQFASRK
jgi:hypothetical protein